MDLLPFLLQPPHGSLWTARLLALALCVLGLALLTWHLKTIRDRNNSRKKLRAE